MEMDLENQVLDMPFGMTNKIFVAIWMVTYNQENYIAQAIESVMMQKTNFKYQLFIGEDCSTDKTKAICKIIKEKYPDKIELILQKENIGAIKNALQVYHACFQSGAKYVAMLEGDDYWTDPLKLQKQVDFLESNHDYVLCFHKVTILKPNGQFVKDFLTTVPKNHETLEDLVQSWNYIHTPSVMFRNVISHFPYEFQLTPIGDFFLYVILAEKGKLKYIEEDMAIYRYGIGVFSGNSHLGKIKSNLKLFTLLLSYLKDDTIKKIILEKQLKSVNDLENFLLLEAKVFFFTKNQYIRFLKFLKSNYNKPLNVLKKVYKKTVR